MLSLSKACLLKALWGTQIPHGKGRSLSCTAVSDALQGVLSEVFGGNQALDRLWKMFLPINRFPCSIAEILFSLDRVKYSGEILVLARTEFHPASSVFDPDREEKVSLRDNPP